MNVETSYALSIRVQNAEQWIDLLRGHRVAIGVAADRTDWTYEQVEWIDCDPESSVGSEAIQVWVNDSDGMASHRRTIELGAIIGINYIERAA